jgi:hypothetical protein
MFKNTAMLPLYYHTTFDPESTQRPSPPSHILLQSRRARSFLPSRPPRPHPDLSLTGIQSQSQCPPAISSPSPGKPDTFVNPPNFKAPEIFLACPRIPNLPACSRSHSRCISCASSRACSTIIGLPCGSAPSVIGERRKFVGWPCF